MPDTSMYFIAGYGVIFAFLLGYIVHLFFLKNKLKRLHREFSDDLLHKGEA